jgi:hypothetical protein
MMVAKLTWLQRQWGISMLNYSPLTTPWSAVGLGRFVFCLSFCVLSTQLTHSTSE